MARGLGHKLRNIINIKQMVVAKCTIILVSSLLNKLLQMYCIIAPGVLRAYVVGLEYIIITHFYLLFFLFQDP